MGEATASIVCRFVCVCHRTIDNAVTPFKLPTAYNAPGQANVADEDEKEKIPIDPNGSQVKDLTTEQLEEVVLGWMRYIRKLIKTNKNTVWEWQFLLLR